MQKLHVWMELRMTEELLEGDGLKESKQSERGDPT